MADWTPSSPGPPPGTPPPSPEPSGSLRGRLGQRLRDPKTRLVTSALLLAAACLALFLVYWIVLLTELPSTDDLRKSRFERATVVYAGDGTELTSYQDKNRRWVGLDEISPHVVHALLAAEDHRFYEHHGIDLFRTAGAFFRTLGGDAQGGSTITMQLARNAFSEIYDDMIVTRKIKEWVTSVRLEAMYEKEEILEMYLNTVPFMYNAFGIEAAAQTYFKVPASELNERGAATLVGMLKGTVFYNPVRHPERSQERRNVVLAKMVEHGYLDQAEYERMKDNPTRLDFERLRRADELAPYFTSYLRQWLDEWAERYGYNLYTDGLRVYTTIDPRLQQAAEAAVERVGDQLQHVADVEWSRSRPPYFSPNVTAYADYSRRVPAFEYFWNTHSDLLDQFIRDTPRFGALRDEGLSAAAALERLRGDAAFVDSVQSVQQRLQVGFVAIDPRSGQVRAWVGGRDYGAIQFDHVAQSKRQPGSTFKPFVYAAALESGYSPRDQLRDEVVEFVDPDTRRRWRPRNAGSVSGQLVSLADALAYSKNTITSQLVLKLGVQRVVETARRMGIQSELPPYPSIGLGTGEVSLLELAGAYTTIADYGQYHEPVFVTRIENQQGDVLASFGGKSRDALSPVTAYNLLDMMRGVVKHGTGQRIRYMFGAEGDFAGKTGTTQNGADGWFMLLHPNLVMGAWVGFDVPAITFRSDYWGQGGHNALHVVGRFYHTARRSAEDVLGPASFQPPAGYRPPPPPVDTTLYAAYYDSSYYDSSYLDSLTAVTDSLLNAAGDYDYGGFYDDSTWRARYEREGEYEDTMMPDADSLDLDRPAARDLSPADSLNRLERSRSRVPDVDRRAKPPAGGRDGGTARPPREDEARTPPSERPRRDTTTRAPSGGGASETPASGGGTSAGQPAGSGASPSSTGGTPPATPEAKDPEPQEPAAVEAPETSPPAETPPDTSNGAGVRRW